MKKQVTSASAPAAFGPFSQAIQTETAVYVSGQIGITPDGLMPPDIVAQTHQAIKNLTAILEAAGMTLDNVVKTTVYLTDIGSFSTINGIYAEYFREPYPARACFQVSGLPNNAKFEIEAIASL